MELSANEMALIVRARQTPEERAADNAARRAAQETAMLNRMSKAECDAYNAEKAAIAAMTPMERVAYTHLTLKSRAEEALKDVAVAAVVDKVKLVIDSLKLSQEKI